MNRLIAIGDIHGQQAMLADLLNQIQPTADDQLVFLGDYIDRGPDSKGVIEILMDLQERLPQTVFIRGNHEQMFLDALVDLGVRQGERLEDLDRDWAWEIRNHLNVAIFEGNGGGMTLQSYGAKLERDASAQHYDRFKLVGEISKTHIIFLEQTRLNYRYENYLFAHAYYTDQDDPYTLLWGCDGRLGWKPYEKEEDEITVVGHNVVDEVVEHVGFIEVDTGAGWGKQLSAIDVLTKRVWQAVPEAPEGWFSTITEPPKHSGEIEIQSLRTRTIIPAYFDGKDCLLNSSNKTDLKKFSFWRPVENAETENKTDYITILKGEKIIKSYSDGREEITTHPKIGCISDLPEEEQVPFENFLTGKSRPREHFFWTIDYENWKDKK